MDKKKVTLTEESLEELKDSVREMVFLLETVAHLQGRERLFIPCCDKVRSALIRVNSEMFLEAIK